MKKIALITGATSGIGKATALKFAENNYDIIITGRRTEKLEELASEIEKTSNSKVLQLCFDVRNKQEVEDSLQSIPENWKKINVLVNNAGLAVGLNTIQEGEVDDWERMIDTNVKGLLYVSRTILPMMIENGFGHVINIGSIAGKEAYANGNVYCATKFAVDALTKTMRIDVLKHGIKVTAIHPGAVETEFSLVRFKGNAEIAKNVYNGFTPLKGEDVADAVFYAANLPLHVNINEIVIMPTAQASTGYFHKV
ncbi:MAG: SDR family NAD(P)-dependent oxidoreductase [Bacteroidetes bacterium]|nr:SDR family NAD(P)-dependent oxidoreductase [Bacteroidota bacterium]